VQESFIETQFSVSKLSKESYKEWKANYSQTLTYLGKWWGRKPLILVGSTAQASCPQEDALLATQNILLAAHSMGLGSCLIGFAVEAVRRDARIARALDLATDERIHTAIALGWPDERYATTAPGRRSPPAAPTSRAGDLEAQTRPLLISRGICRARDCAAPEETKRSGPFPRTQAPSQVSAITRDDG